MAQEHPAWKQLTWAQRILFVPFALACLVASAWLLAQFMPLVLGLFLSMLPLGLLAYLYDRWRTAALLHQRQAVRFRLYYYVAIAAYVGLVFLAMKYGVHFSSGRPYEP